MQYSYNELRRRADVCQALVYARMRKLYSESGLPPRGFPDSARTAAAAWRNNTPWADVDYTKVFKIVELQDTQLNRAHRLLMRLVLQGKTDLVVRFECVTHSRMALPSFPAAPITHEHPTTDNAHEGYRRAVASRG